MSKNIALTITPLLFLVISLFIPTKIDAACGALTEQCCAAPGLPPCNTGLTCYQSTCHDPATIPTPTPRPNCGQENENCCPGNPGGDPPCDSGLSCHQGTCLNPVNVPTPTTNPKCDMPGESCCYSVTGRFCSNGLTCHPDTNRCTTGVGNTPAYPTFNICEFAKTDADKCAACVGNPDEPKGMWTAIGCIPTNPSDLVTGLIKFAMGIAGGIAFLIMLYGAFTIITAGGNPEKMAGGQQTITAALMGLFTILFAAVILNIVGVQIIQIPGF